VTKPWLARVGEALVGTAGRIAQDLGTRAAEAPDIIARQLAS
jgi:hypothetical protein